MVRSTVIHQLCERRGRGGGGEEEGKEERYLHGNNMFSCFHYTKAYVFMYCLHLVLTFPPKMMVNGITDNQIADRNVSTFFLLCTAQICHKEMSHPHPVTAQLADGSSRSPRPISAHSTDTTISTHTHTHSGDCLIWKQSHWEGLVLCAAAVRNKFPLTHEHL